MYVSVCLSAVCKHEHPHLKHICIRKFTYVSIPSPSQPLLKNMSEQVYKLPHSFKEIRDGEGANLISPNPFFACCNVPKHWYAWYYHMCVCGAILSIADVIFVCTTYSEMEAILVTAIGSSRAFCKDSDSAQCYKHFGDCTSAVSGSRHQLPANGRGSWAGGRQIGG